MNLQQLNSLAEKDATHAFLQCCTSSLWVKTMEAARPYKDIDSVVNTANSAWNNLAEVEYLDAFSGHPKIGDVNSLREKYASTKELATGEQRSVEQACETTLNALAKGNEEYEEKFGFIFIVCATGKSAAEMLTLLESRLPNNRATELFNAAEEQRKIFQLRLTKLFDTTD